MNEEHRIARDAIEIERAMSQTLLPLIRASRKLIAKGWCRNTYARKSGGCKVGFYDPDAKYFCILGAFMRAGRDNEMAHLVSPCLDQISKTILSKYGYAGRVHNFQDNHCRNKKQVLAVFDETIKRLKKNA